jgi:DNA-binding FadR family transcriptional regulator
LNTAEATHNARYFELLQSLRPMIAPRVSLRDLAGDYSSEEFSGRMQNEHEAIVNAIDAGDARSARDAMRRHFDASLKRMRSLPAAYGIAPKAAGGQRVSISQTPRPAEKGRREVR